MRGRCAVAGLLVAAVSVAGCGAEEFPNDPRPPTAVELSGKIDNQKVTVIPSRVGAGLATFTITNQSGDDVQLDFRGPNRARTTEIPAGGVGALQFELETGEYTVEPDVPTISPATMTVGAERPSARNDLLLP
ncbi:MAG: hypothetical protein R2691_08405 [Solirubrobacterales bacterium]